MILFNGVAFPDSDVDNAPAYLEGEIGISRLNGPGIIKFTPLGLPLSKIDQGANTCKENHKNYDDYPLLHGKTSRTPIALSSLAMLML